MYKHVGVQELCKTRAVWRSRSWCFHNSDAGVVALPGSVFASQNSPKLCVVQGVLVSPESFQSARQALPGRYASLPASEFQITLQLHPTRELVTAVRALLLVSDSFAHNCIAVHMLASHIRG